ncbi:MAG TPA: DUF1573 domain-containing protein [Schlesneria sp.]
MAVRSVSHLLVPLVVVAMSAAPVAAQEWGNKMFDRTEIKFGSVARLADTTFKIKVRNPYVETIQITNLSTSCGCISWTDKQFPISIPSKGERELTIRLDTIGHSGDKHVRAFASLSEPSKGLTAQVTIPVDGRIRTDFEVHPSYVGFGPIDLGKGYIQRIGITYNGGRPDWKILQAKVNNTHLTAQVTEKSRSGGSVTYEATVQIDANAPLGVLRDQLILTTNDVGGDSTISIPVEAKVEPDIVVADAMFGSLVPGQPKTMQVIIRGKKPFTIEKVDHVVHAVVAKPTEDGTVGGTAPDTVSLGDAISAKTPTTSAALHMVTVTVTPPAEGGMFDEEFSVVIAGRPRPITFKAKGRISAPDGTASK